MSSTADCVKMLVQEMDGNLSASFNKLIEGDRTNWKRVSKFHYRNGVRRYFYLVDSALIATVDEREATPEELETIRKELEVMLEHGVNIDDISSFEDKTMVKIVIRPPMLWEQYMLQDIRTEDQYVQEDLGELWEKYYDFCIIEAAKGS